MYCTLEDIQNRLDPKHLIELADDDADGTADSAAIEAVIADADALIDSHLALRYSVPLSPVPPLVAKLSADLAIASLFARRRESASQIHEDRARAAAALLAELTEGRIVLAGLATTTASSGLESTTRGDEKTFDRYALDSF